ncbi:MAG: recN [Flavipsychrobacter sp.]|nr:recN [Flavipsychrobacter sp.]
MLQKLVIKNYAIIDHLVIEPDAHLNTVTGETGAGKSIILGALSLILGERADTSVLINKDEKSVIEGYFDVSNNEVFKTALANAELDYDTQCIIRREIAINGKSRAFINDTPVTLSVLNTLTSLLVDLHQQFDHMALEDDNFQMEALDAIGGSTQAADSYRKLYYKHKKINQQLTEHREKRAQWQKESDYKQYLLDELLQASFKEDELEHAEQQLKQMSHAEHIISVLQAGRMMLEEGEQPIVNELKRISQQLQSITELVPEVKPLQERLASAHAELKDIAAELEAEEGKVALDPSKMDELQQRLDLGYKLLKKHAAKTTAELLEWQHKLTEELKATMDVNEAIERLAKEEGIIFKELIAEAEQLSAMRKKVIPSFAQKINELLILVGMPNARFDIRTEPIQPSAHGTDRVQFLLDANKSGQFQLLQKAASGGEMSRIMLCIKSLTAKALHMPTLIFDEVDTGISGEAARQVAILLRELSQYHQVICITHQPQVAAKGSRHFYVYKEADKNERLSTRIKVLQQDERVLAIARMIGGEQPSDAAISNAKELVA